MFQICYYLKITIIKPKHTFDFNEMKSLIIILLITSSKASPKCRFSVNFEISFFCLNLRKTKTKCWHFSRIISIELGQMLI